MDGKQCLDKDCVFFHEEPNSTIAFCHLAHAASAYQNVKTNLESMTAAVSSLTQELAKARMR